jgi:hypothetical protein
MSSDGDQIAVHNSLNDNLADSNNVPFNEKNYTFITDSTSNSGSFSSGQIQFDLSTLNSQSQWINLSEATIEFPVKITAQINTAGTGTETTKSIAAINTAIIKNSWTSWVDSAQLIINGQTIQSSQPYENVAASFRILSTWSQDTMQKWAPTCGFALDDCTGDSDVTTTISNTVNMANSIYSTVATSVKGFDCINNQASLFNKGVQTRSCMTNNDINPFNPSGGAATPNIQTTILGASSMKIAGRNHASGLYNGSNTASAYIYSAFYMATCRLKDLCDINDFPLVKNLKGYLYLSFNSSQVNLTGTAGSAVLSAVSVTTLTGRTTPFMINNSSTGILLGNYATTAPIVQIVGTVDGTSTGAQTNAGPLLTNARFIVPYLIANPSTDLALSQTSKFFTTLEKIVNPITATASASINYTISVGVPNPRKLVLLPMWQNLGGSNYLSNPEISPFDSVPATSGPYASLSNFQVYLGNKPLYQYPIQIDYEQWLSENSQLGLNGNMINEQTSGLLSEQLFNQNHKFYYVDLSRRMESEDGTSKSIQVSFTNPSANFGLKIIAIVFYEKKWLINTATCQISSA